MEYKTSLLGAAVVAAGMAFGGAASAATVEVFSEGTFELRAVVTCNACSVLNYDGTDYGFGDPGELFNGPSGSAYGPGSPTDQELAWLNDILGTSFTDFDKDDNADQDNVEYTTSALYAVVKVGVTPNYTIIRNDSGGDLVFSWDGESGAGAGISHYTAIGGEIPVPAAGFLLLGGLGAFAALRRRKS